MSKKIIIFVFGIMTYAAIIQPAKSPKYITKFCLEVLDRGFDNSKAMTIVPASCGVGCFLLNDTLPLKKRILRSIGVLLGMSVLCGVGDTIRAHLSPTFEDIQLWNNHKDTLDGLVLKDNTLVKHSLAGIDHIENFCFEAIERGFNSHYSFAKRFASCGALYTALKNTKMSFKKACLVSLGIVLATRALFGACDTARAHIWPTANDISWWNTKPHWFYVK